MIETTTLQIINQIVGCTTPFVIATSAAIAFGVLRRTTRNDLDGRLFSMNDDFEKLKVVGPIVKAAFPLRDQKAQLEIQKRVIMMLHMLNLFRGYWSSYNNKILGFLPGIPKEDWIRTETWFKGTVLPWIRQDNDLRYISELLYEMHDSQEKGFSEYVRDCMIEMNAQKGKSDL